MRGLGAPAFPDGAAVVGDGADGELFESGAADAGGGRCDDGGDERLPECAELCPLLWGALLNGWGAQVGVDELVDVDGHPPADVEEAELDAADAGDGFVDVVGVLDLEPDLVADDFERSGSAERVMPVAAGQKGDAAAERAPCRAAHRVLETREVVGAHQLVGAGEEREGLVGRHGRGTALGRSGPARAGRDRPRRLFRWGGRPGGGCCGRGATGASSAGSAGGRCR